MMNEDKKSKLQKAVDVYDSFQSDFDYTNRHTKSYAEAMWEIIESEKVSYLGPNGKLITSFIRDGNHFEEVTGLSASTYDSIMRNVENYVPSLTTFMTLCMVYQLNMTMVRELRHSYGYDFNAKSRIHQAYIYLLVNCRGKSLSYCNKVLQALGIERKHYLGDGTIDEDAVNFDVMGV